MERTRRGKNQRARSGSVNVLSGAPFGYRYVRKGDHAAARYEVVPHEAAIVAGLFRRYADEGVPIAELARWLGSTGVATRTGKARWDRSTIWGMLRNPAYAGRACVRQDRPAQRARLAGRATGPLPPTPTVDRPRSDWLEIDVPALVNEATFARVAPPAWPTTSTSPPATPRLRRCPRACSSARGAATPATAPPPDHRWQQDLLLPVHRQRQLPVRARQGLRQQARPRRLSRPGRVGSRHRPAHRPVPDPHRD